MSAYFNLFKDVALPWEREYRRMKRYQLQFVKDVKVPPAVEWSGFERIILRKPFCQDLLKPGYMYGQVRMQTMSCAPEIRARQNLLNGQRRDCLCTFPGTTMGKEDCLREITAFLIVPSHRSNHSSSLSPISLVTPCSVRISLGVERSAGRSELICSSPLIGDLESTGSQSFIA